MDLEKTMYVGTLVAAAFDAADNFEQLMSAVGTSLDFWAVKHGYGAEDVEKALRALLQASEDAHRQIGMPDPDGEEGTDETIL